MNNSNAARAAWGEALVIAELASDAWYAEKDAEASKEHALWKKMNEADKAVDRAKDEYLSAVAVEKIARDEKLEIEEQMILSGKMRDPNDVHADIA